MTLKSRILQLINDTCRKAPTNTPIDYLLNDTYYKNLIIIAIEEHFNIDIDQSEVDNVSNIQQLVGLVYRGIKNNEKERIAP